MGTRHRQAVINKDGELKIQQYGQWDGYPSGQGLEILKYLRNGNLDKYQEELNKIPLITKQQENQVGNDKNWKQKYPFLSRDCGANIHQMIEDGEVLFVYHIDEAEARYWCEAFYTIDFQKRLFITEYYEHKVELKLDNLSSEDEYLKLFMEN